MTKKHFIQIANVFKQQRQDADGPAAVSAIDGTAEALAGVFARINPLFDSDRFLTACGYKQESEDDGFDLKEAARLAE